MARRAKNRKKGGQNDGPTKEDAGKAQHADEAYDESDAEDYSDSEDEGPDDYKKGGYHPVRIGDKYKNGRYTVLRKLGWGHFSTVWLVLDAEGNQYRALKVQKSAQHYTEAARDEVVLLTQLKEGDPNDSHNCVRLHDHFEHSGPHGRHVCLVFEVLGDNLLALIKRYDYKGIPIPVVQNLARQMLAALDYMHREREIIHTDFKPENVMLVEPLRDRVWELPGTGAAQPGPAAATQGPGQAPEPATKAASAAAAANGALTRNQKKKLKKKQKRVAARQGDQADDPSQQEEDGGDPMSEGEDGSSLATEVTGTTCDHAGSVAASGEEAVSSRPEGAEPMALATQDALAAAAPAPTAAAAAPGTTVAVAADGDVTAVTAAACGRVASGADASTSGVEPVVVVRAGLTEEQLLTATCKVVDFGNACWTYKQFTQDVQTRQYRSPEVILGAKYSTPADMWSLACVVFELVTGDLLFDPKSGDKWNRDEDHLALFMELLGRMPRRVYEKGKYAREFFNRNGELRHIKKLKFWPLDRVMVEKYGLPEDEAMSLAAFLTPMLRFVPEDRATAQEMLGHAWLRGELEAQQPGADTTRSDRRLSRGGGSRSASPRRHRSGDGNSRAGSRDSHEQIQLEELEGEDAVLVTAAAASRQQ